MINEIIQRNNVNLQRVSSKGRVDLALENEIFEVKLGGQVCRPAPLKVEFRKMLVPMPLLFLAGIFTGVGIMLALN
jgi:hypothetical protein